ncbi:hypothetical protein [Microlunatus parietis]|uniref:Uncharacterized protein n=1 Tax=Microlunatus parietis TaxID=682979 RepID=A0A7Y9I5G4_9ACTN|nr:hypothetical protein [Microlunatus parietis]NYE70557.1 hypothetical protein [Microlunatus parietis]
MTEPGRAHTRVRCARVERVITHDAFRLDGTEVDDIRTLYCVVDDEHRPGSVALEASEADVDRWRRASADLVRVLDQADAERFRATARLIPPSSAARWLAWRLRGGRTDKVRHQVDAAVEQIQSEVRAAYLTFRDQAADLTDRVEADQQRKREENARQWREQKAARERAIAEVAQAPVWSYQVGPNYTSTGPRRHRLVIALQLLERPPNPSLGEPVTGLTPAQVNDAIDRLRTEDPYLVVDLEVATRQRLVEWTEEQLLDQQWLRVSGVKIDPHPFTPEELEEIHNQASKNTWHGPSSNYFSPPSF